ncbi:MAG: RNA 2',3'-cyclic phosphodiesterase [Gammaproteobacteria bacterium]|nr:RNA 2',3'-cyclic phosphodiesterase [Gammaproteobacteria bacterium]NNL06907.1 RNA 2',3'-cyclic phosphodiesterase [Gammaproteobacteria bacterium]
MAEKQKQRRLFLALWPDDISRKKLAAVQKRMAGNERLKTAKAVVAANLHITIHFLGLVADDVQAQLQSLLSEVEAESSMLIIDRWGYFPRAKVVWLGAQTAPAAVNELVAQTQACIQSCIEGYDQKRFVPHITVFRKARHPLEVDDFDPIEWHIDRFALVESVTHPQGPEYTVLKEWMLS